MTVVTDLVETIAERARMERFDALDKLSGATQRVLARTVNEASAPELVPLLLAAQVIVTRWLGDEVGQDRQLTDSEKLRVVEQTIGQFLRRAEPEVRAMLARFHEREERRNG